MLYLVGAIAFLAFARRDAPAAATGLKLAGLITLAWFATFPEPRYLLPALCLVAAARGVGLDAILPRRRGAAILLWLVPLAALIHTQWNAAMLLPWRYGEVMQLIHEAPGPDALGDRLAALGITHVLVNTNNIARYRTWYVEGYGAPGHERSLTRLSAFLAQDTTPVIEDRGVIVRRLKPASGP